MNDLSNFNLTVLSGILKDPLVAAFIRYRSEKTTAARSEFLFQLFEKKAEDNLAEYIKNVVLEDENAFSKACSAGREISKYLKKAYIADLETIGRALDFTSDDFRIGKSTAPIKVWDEKAANLLNGFYQSNGYGQFISHAEFRYQNGKLSAVQSPSSLTLNDLKGYESEKQTVYDNIENFVRKLPYSDMILYGDRGTGKSSTVHAMAKFFFSQKLRLIEIDKEEISAIPDLKAYLSEIPLRFLIFIDDLSWNENDDRISSLKTALQGSAEGNANNVMIVATSDRKYVVGDSSKTNEPELLSLSDRFGIAVPFSTTDKPTYLDIVHRLAEEENLSLAEKELDSLAESWALVRGGRSPRRARQLIGYLVACRKKGKEIQII